MLNIPVDVHVGKKWGSSLRTRDKPDIVFVLVFLLKFLGIVHFLVLNLNWGYASADSAFNQMMGEPEWDGDEGRGLGGWFMNNLAILLILEKLCEKN